MYHFDHIIEYYQQKIDQLDDLMTDTQYDEYATTRIIVRRYTNACRFYDAAYLEFNEPNKLEYRMGDDNYYQ